MKKVYLNDRICASAVERLKKYVELVNNFDHPEELDAIIVRQQHVQRDVIEKAVNCKLIQMHGVGLDRIDLQAAKECGIPVKNTKGGNARSVAELAIGLMLAVSRKIVFLDKGVPEGKFPVFGLPVTEGNEISYKKVGLVGCGQIAQIAAQMLMLAFGCSIYVYDPHASAEKCESLGYTKVNTLFELASMVDILSIHVPLSEDTYHMFNDDFFEHCNPNLILINTSRGGIVDECALYRALVSGKIKAAGMDVFEIQPPRKDNILFKLDNFVGTVHVGGSTKECLERNGNMLVDNVFEALGIVE